MKRIIIAIDGFSSCGKSTLAKGLAKSLHYAYLDSGAMYRAVTLYFLDNQIDYNDPAAVEEALTHIEIHFERIDGQNRTFLNGRDVERAIREMRVSDHVSPVSAISAVRRAMVRQQQAMGARRGIVADGRDIGTVVFPHAEVKLFMTASPEVRAMRRYNELKGRGVDVDPAAVMANIRARDLDDTTRAADPLVQAPDAVVIDNSELTAAEQFDEALGVVVRVIGEVAEA